MPKLRFLSLTTLGLAVWGFGLPATAQLPDAPSAAILAAVALHPDVDTSASTADSLTGDDLDGQAKQDNHGDGPPQAPGVEVDKDGNPIPIERQQPHRILGFMPNFRSVSDGAITHPPGWKYNFKIATRQAFDYSSFVFLGITSLSAEATNVHPVLGKGIPGFYAYTWRGFLDKTDGTYIGAWFLPSLLHEDTRYYAMGNRRSPPVRVLYVMSRQVVTRTYGQRQTPNIAGLGGKVLTQIVSRQYYPAGTTSFSVLATKFAYSAMRDMAITSIREFYPDIAAHYVHKHQEKMARLSAKDATP